MRDLLGREVPTIPTRMAPHGWAGSREPTRLSHFSSRTEAGSAARTTPEGRALRRLFYRSTKAPLAGYLDATPPPFRRLGTTGPGGRGYSGETVCPSRDVTLT
jgi:hypothetical protein